MLRGRGLLGSSMPIIPPAGGHPTTQEDIPPHHPNRLPSPPALRESQTCLRSLEHAGGEVAHPDLLAGAFSGLSSATKTFSGKPVSEQKQRPSRTLFFWPNSKILAFLGGTLGYNPYLMSSRGSEDSKGLEGRYNCDYSFST